MSSLKDLAGQRFGRLTVIRRAKNSRLVCQCDCGNQILVYRNNLKSGSTKSCGCLKRESDAARPFTNLSGERFGRWAVIRRARNKNGRVCWLCKCDCGKEKNIVSHSLIRGDSKSCGCLRREVTVQRSTTHGMRDSRLYQIWSNMKTRCSNPNSTTNWPNYGGRGIRVCDEWYNSFEAFAEWALANGYRDDLTLDRKDNDGNYTPDNCRWATRSEQALNRRPKAILDRQEVAEAR